MVYTAIKRKLEGINININININIISYHGFWKLWTGCHFCSLCFVRIYLPYSTYSEYLSEKLTYHAVMQARVSICEVT